MLERIVLAVVITFCIYLSLNLGSKPSSSHSFDAKNDVESSLLHRVALFAF